MTMNLRATACDTLHELCRLTMLRDILKSEPMQEFFSMLEQMEGGNVLEAEKLYHSLTALLLTKKSRRVSGSIFSDFILYNIIETENAFTHAVLNGYVDTPTYSAMKNDLDILIAVSKLKTADVAKWFENSIRHTNEVEPQASKVGESLWGGLLPQGSSEQSTATHKRLPARMPAPQIKLFEWEYDVSEENDSQSCIPELLEIYALLQSDNCNAATAIDELWTFFDEFGSGVFLTSRSFCYNRGSFMPVAIEERKLPCIYPTQRIAFSKLFSAFVSGHESTRPIGIHGSANTETRAFVQAFAADENDFRAIYLGKLDMNRENILNILSALSVQPQSYVLVLDGLPCDCELLCETDIMCANVLVVAIFDGNANGELYRFMNKLVLTPPTLDEFSACVAAYLEEGGTAVEMPTLKNMCADFTLETHMPFGYAAASAIIDEYHNNK